MDFIYFFYGLAFLLIGFVCFSIYRMKKNTMMWVLLASFAVLRGIYQWLVMFQTIFGENYLLTVAILVLHLASFALLFEFGRKGVNYRKKHVGCWVYVPIGVILFITSLVWGAQGLSDFTRYTFGLLGSILTALTLWRFSSEKKEVMNFARSAAGLVFLYGLSQFITKPDALLAQTGISIIFVRAVGATLLFICFWFYYEHVLKEDIRQKKSGVSKRVALFALFLLSTYVGGFLLINSLGAQAKSEVHKETNRMIQVVSENLNGIIVNTQNTVSTLSLFPDVRSALENGEVNGNALNRILDAYQKLDESTVAYVMNLDGVVIGSSNRFEKDSFLGMNYGFRPYFKQALQEGGGSYYAIGVTSGLPGYYASRPVRNAQNETIGVVVLKTTLHEVKDTFLLYRKMYLVSPEGVVLFGGDDSERKSIVPLSADQINTLEETKQFGSGALKPMFSEWPVDASVISMDHETFFVCWKQINDQGWKVLLLYRSNLIQNYRFFGIVLILLFYIILLISVSNIQMIKKNLSVQYFASIVFSTQDAIIGKDFTGKILSWNTGAQKIYGYTAEEMIGQDMVLLIKETDQDKYKKELDFILGGKTIENYEMKHVKKNGESIDVSITDSPLRDVDGHFIGSTVISRDISKLKKIEKMRTEFVSIASHQLRTPLTGIKWFSELLLNGRVGELKKEQKEYIQQISDSNQRMIELVNDLLEVSHIDDEAKYKMDLARYDFSEVIKKVVDQQKVVAKIRKVSINLDANCLKKTIVNIDHVRMEDVLENLMSNAMKFSKPKSMIYVSCKKSSDQLICSVRDTGLGIPKQQQARIFEKFFRADNAVETGNGTGLGLYIAKSIVEAHKGKMWFESEFGKGSTFYFSLPIDKV